jgi:hypothetical protein
MRFEVRFNNGVYHVFDTIVYKAVEAFGKSQRAEAIMRAAVLNTTPRGPRRK